MKIVLLLHITITMAASIHSLQRQEEAIIEDLTIRLIQGVKEGRQNRIGEVLDRSVRVSLLKLSKVCPPNIRSISKYGQNINSFSVVESNIGCLGTATEPPMVNIMSFPVLFSGKLS